MGQLQLILLKMKFFIKKLFVLKKLNALFLTLSEIYCKFDTICYAWQRTLIEMYKNISWTKLVQT